MKKRFVIVLVSIALSLVFFTTTFAGQWKRDNKGWWYKNDDATYPSGGWYWIDTKCFYFTPEGYCLINTTTPDGYTVDINGAWCVDGVIQYEGLLSLTYCEDAIIQYYSNLDDDDGDYVIFDHEATQDENYYYFLVRYQMSEEEAQERIEAGRDVYPNIYVAELSVDKETGIVYNDEEEYFKIK